MSNHNSSKTLTTKDQKYCQHCGQKTFRPHRSVKELVFEFVENWFGYDSKAFKTARALSKPAALTLDYFRNSHHHNHYVTPIRLYIFLSIIFFLLTKFGGFNVAKLDIEQHAGNRAEQQVQQAVTQSPVIDEDVKQKIAEDDAEPTDILEKDLSNAETNDGFAEMCKAPDSMFELSISWLDSYVDERAQSLCESYNNINYLPKEKQVKAKVLFVLTIVQSAIESLPQTFLFTTPLLALVLFLLYLRSRHLYIEHLVLLIHSHCFIFAAILIYLGWHQIVDVIPWLNYVPLGWLLLLWVLVYLFISMKRFYRQSYKMTILKFIVFSMVYIVVFGFITFFAMMAALMSL